MGEQTASRRLPWKLRWESVWGGGEAPSGKTVGIQLHMQSYRRASYPRIVLYTRTYAHYQQVSHGVLSTLIRFYLCYYAVEDYAETGSTPRISTKIPTILLDGASGGYNISELGNQISQSLNWVFKNICSK